MEKHVTVQLTDAYRVNNPWRDAVRIASKYEEHLPEFLILLKHFSSMWDRHHGRTTLAQ